MFPLHFEAELQLEVEYPSRRDRNLSTAHLILKD